MSLPVAPPAAAFTPIQTSMGALLLHMASNYLLTDVGAVLGVSGILYGAVFGGSGGASRSSSSAPSPAASASALSSGKGKGKAKPKDAASAATPTPASAGPIKDEPRARRWAFLAGMVLVPVVLRAGVSLSAALGDPLGTAGVVTGDVVGSWRLISRHLGRVGTAGFLVGLGSKLGSGCTSGHFLCGVSRLSPRSLIATATFFPISILTAYLFPFSLPYTPLATPAYIPRGITDAQTLLLPLPLALAVIARGSVLSTARSAPAGSYARLAPHAFCGALFALGLLLSGMADPAKVAGFLRVNQWNTTWDPSLAMVFLFAVLPNGAAYGAYLRKFRRASPPTEPKPRLAWARWDVPTRRDVDARLVLGAAAFGVGWGLVGVCPGPAIVGAAYTAMGALLGESVESVKAAGAFLGAALVGMFSAGLI